MLLMLLLAMRQELLGWRVLEQDGLVRVEHYLADEVFATLVALDYQVSVREVDRLAVAMATVWLERRREVVRVRATVAERVEVVEADGRLVVQIGASGRVDVEPALERRRRGLDERRRRGLASACCCGRRGSHGRECDEVRLSSGDR